MISSKFNQLFVVGIFATVLALATGCAPKESTIVTSPTAPEVAQTQSQSTDKSIEPVAFTNKKGQLICPVMGSVITSKDAAVGYADYDGKRYYFCCGECPGKFKASPKKYTEGASL